jgi:electron transport complex protein RnfG
MGVDRDGHILGVRVIQHKETPGLGDKIAKDTGFVNGFNRVTAPLKGVKVGQGKGEPNEVDMITGATISSRATIGIINHALEHLQPMIEAYAKAGGS